MTAAVGTLRAHIVAKEVRQALMRSTTFQIAVSFDGPRMSPLGYERS